LRRGPPPMVQPAQWIIRPWICMQASYASLVGPGLNGCALSDAVCNAVCTV